MGHIVTATLIVAKVGDTERYLAKGATLPEGVSVKERKRLVDAGVIASVREAPVADPEAEAKAKEAADAKAAEEAQAAADAEAKAKEAADAKAAEEAQAAADAEAKAKAAVAAKTTTSSK